MAFGKNVFLIGMMGSGKSRAGKRLANKLGIAYWDMDAEIEQAHKLTISQIFEQYGEDAFRIMEYNWLNNFILSNKPAVVSTGGGTPCIGNNMQLMNTHGITVWLNPSVYILADRLWRNRSTRPIIAALGSEEEIGHFVQHLMEKRQPFYAMAHINRVEAPPLIDELAQVIINY